MGESLGMGAIETDGRSREENDITSSGQTRMDGGLEGDEGVDSLFSSEEEGNVIATFISRNSVDQLVDGNRERLK